MRPDAVRMTAECAPNASLERANLHASPLSRLGTVIDNKS